MQVVTGGSLVAEILLHGLVFHTSADTRACEIAGGFILRSILGHEAILEKRET
jgi:hypothetical protein